MKMDSLRSTRDDRVGAAIRIVLGILFLTTGVMKLFVPALGVAFAGQFAAPSLLLPNLSRWVVPFVEIGVGGALLVGFHTRIAALVVIGIMIVATYAHLAVDDPSLFPLQPERPIVPITVIILSVYLLQRGGAAGNLDRRAVDGLIRLSHWRS